MSRKSKFHYGRGPYTASAGDSVPYINGYVKLPDEYLKLTMKSVGISEFTGDRSIRNE